MNEVFFERVHSLGKKSQQTHQQSMAPEGCELFIKCGQNQHKFWGQES